MNNLYAIKATLKGDIPTKIIKDNKDHFSYFISQALTMLWGGKGGETSAVLLTELAKACDCLPHDLLIAKPHGIKEGSLNLLFSYLKNRKQRVRLNNTYSEWIDISFGVPQGSILGPLLFNVFFCDFFLFLNDIPVATTPHFVLV